MIRYAKQPGRFVRHCPCSPDTVSCGYHNIHLHQGCPFDCTYCILQAYLQDHRPVFYTNYSELERELESMRDFPALRLGTGELADSLALDHETNYSLLLLDIFERFPEMVFEFKTKSIRIGNLMNDRRILSNIVVAWSMNPESICLREELKAPSLKSRLDAMDAIAKKGYRIAIHFDPMLAVAGWKDLYSFLVEEIARRIPADRIAWWSLGALRFPSALRNRILSRPGNRLFSGELVSGYDGKYRYFKPLREMMFRHALTEIRARVSREVPVYLCMEDSEMWGAVLPEWSAEESWINERLFAAAMR